MNLPNLLTFTRIFISPIFLVLYLTHSYFGISEILLPYLLIFLMGISELSDAFDGYFARKFNQVTDLGKVLDPMADSIYRISIFLTFTLPPINLPIILIFIFIYRDSVISTLRTICAMRGFVLAARTSGKFKAVIQAIAAFIIILLLIPHSLGELSTTSLRQYSTYLVSIAAIYAIFSGLDYLYANRGYIHRLIVNQKA